MAVTTSPKMLSEWLNEEISQNFNRENVTVVAGQNLVTGDVLGKITASGKYAAYDNAAVDGTELAVAVAITTVDATAADATAVILARGPAVIITSGLGWDGQAQPAIDAGLADLAAADIIARTGI